MKPPLSLFDRYISRPRRPWINVGVVILCMAVPLGVAVLERGLSTPTQARGILIAPVIIAYILAVAPRLALMEARVRESIGPLLRDAAAGAGDALDDLPPLNPGWEAIAFGAGVAFSLLFGLSNLIQDFSWIGLTMMLEGGLMYGLMGVVFYGAIDSTRVTGRLLRGNLRVDPLDVSPFEAVGKQSLALSLAFVGGITLSLILSWVSVEILRYWQFWAIYTPLAGIPILIFFLNMLPIHRLLQSARDAELRRIDRLIRETGANLVREVEQGGEAMALSQQLTALTAVETRLQQARTWPYNTAMLRTIFVSILVPGGTVVGRLLLEALKR